MYNSNSQSALHSSPQYILSCIANSRRKKSLIETDIYVLLCMKLYNHAQARNVPNLSPHLNLKA